MTDRAERAPRRLPWWIIGAVVVLAALGAIWLVKIILGAIWLLLQVAVLALIVLVVFAVLRARSRGRRGQRDSTT